MNERQVRCLLRAALGFLVAKQNLAGAFNNGRKTVPVTAKANKYASKLISGKLPLMVRGYADTPVARLLLANTVSFVATNYSDKLGDKAPIVQSVADAMVVSAYSEMLAHFDIDGFIEDFLSSKEMKRVGTLLKTDEEEAPRRRRNVNEEGDK